LPETFADCLADSLADPASSGGLVGIQPAEANRKTFAAE
jgi:hypothetical protein